MYISNGNEPEITHSYMDNDNWLWVFCGKLSHENEPSSIPYDFLIASTFNPYVHEREVKLIFSCIIIW